MNILTLENISASYGSKTVIDEMSLRVEASDILTLVGPNGAGKSTALKVAAGTLSPDSGEVHFDQQSITHLPPHERMKLGLGYCIQGGRVFPSLTVYENLKLGTRTLSTDEREEVLDEMLALFPVLKPLMNDRAGVLSGGERQALALGMVLGHRPRTLLLDEPSAGLSPRLVRDLLDKVRLLNQEWGVSVLLVEQNVGEALRIADRAAVMVEGTIAEETDEPQDWIDGSVLESLFLSSVGASSS